MIVGVCSLMVVRCGRDSELPELESPSSDYRQEKKYVINMLSTMLMRCMFYGNMYFNVVANLIASIISIVVQELILTPDLVKVAESEIPKQLSTILSHSTKPLEHK